MNTYKRQGMLILLTAFVASVFFIFLYRYDNKYAHAADQPANGLFVLTEADLMERPVRYLYGGWAFYPDVLLNPADFVDGDPQRYMRYVNIGESTRFDGFGRRSKPHGCGTYVLHMRLPAEANAYALELPEIFSAYRLYVDGKLMMQVGEPSPERYRAETQSKVIIFDKRDSMTLILAVSDYSHFYSGLVYPPAFGTPDAVSQHRYFRIAIKQSSTTIALLAAALSLYLAIRMRYKNAVLFSLLCLCMCLSTSYPLVHTMFALPVFPWYALELAGSYFLTLLVLILHNRICDASRIRGRVTNLTAAIFAVLALAYGLMSSRLTAPLMQVFNVALFGFKAGVAFYLLSSSWLSARKQKSDAAPLFYASIIYAVAFICDRLLPSYEPIFGGWFPEWGSLALMLAVGYTLWHDIVRAYAMKTLFEDERRHLSRQMEIQRAHYSELNDKISEAEKHRHDQRHHLQMIGNLLESGALDKLRAYLEDYRIVAETKERAVFCLNPTLDALLRYYKTLCTAKKISFETEVDMPEDLPISDTDLSILCGNLLENAFEACSEQQKPDPVIRIKCGWREEQFLFRVENSYDTPVQMMKGQYLSRKHEGYGIGTESAKAVVKRYNGHIKFNVSEDVFRVSVLIYSSICQASDGKIPKHSLNTFEK